MPETASDPVVPADEPFLRDLHRRYLNFMRQLAKERQREYPWLAEFGEFVAWWRRLPLAVQQVCEQDFFKGYDEVVAEGEREVAAVLARYER
jgi:hypothetical protein